jgi:hypothetical protein
MLIYPKIGFFKKVVTLKETNYWPFDQDFYLKKFELTISDFSFFRRYFIFEKLKH